MEKIRIKDTELEIINIKQLSNTLLEITFPQVINLTSYDLSKIDVLTDGNLVCTTFEGYITVYKIDDNKVILSSDKSVYTENIELEIINVLDNAKEIANKLNPTLNDIKQDKINELNKTCNETIINGFYSDADGIKKQYDFELENQVNLSTKAYQLQIAKLAGQPITTVSYYAKGETCHDYTAEQFLKLALDGETWKTTNIVKYKDVLKPKVEACKTADEVNVITWESDVNATQTTV